MTSELKAQADDVKKAIKAGAVLRQQCDFKLKVCDSKEPRGFLRKLSTGLVLVPRKISRMIDLLLSHF